MTHTCYKNNNDVTKPKHCLQTENHTKITKLPNYRIFGNSEEKKVPQGN